MSRIDVVTMCFGLSAYIEMAVMSGGEVLDKAASGQNLVVSSDAVEPRQG